VVQLSSLGRRVEMLEEPDGIFDPQPPSDGMGGAGRVGVPPAARPLSRTRTAL
jgi:hypothetical protein